MENETFKELWRVFLYGDIPPQGELNSIYYEIRVE